ncbi:ADP-ribosylglycohydrolase family protein [Nesterenkonia aurantiaca]|uniref:ADP-ribosylglycohydrolase family protein n=1 Tax=Nesterenkonia aurantiaca TaxID=1436010 RepID=UPI003EE691EA
MSGVQSSDGRADRVVGSLLAAAVGDALGWPQGNRSKNLKSNPARHWDKQMRFRSWTRSGGDRFAPYKDPVSAGEYSDITQSLLAVGRACLRDNDWYTWLTEVELPQSTVYQRGGSETTLRAARSWQAGRIPWTLSRTKHGRLDTRYFGAGGSGAAARIAPHALRTTGIGDIGDLLPRVVRGSLATHGHPRATLGAAIYAIALCHAQHRPDTLERGGLVDAIADEGTWRSLDLLFENVDDTWLRNHQHTSGQDSHHPTDIATSWRETVQEVEDSLRTIKTYSDPEDQRSDYEVLDALGAFNSRINGAGTVSALTSVYMATRYASRPVRGLLRAAHLSDTDTSTLTSMAASLLGAQHGAPWLGSLRETVQDSQYISWLGAELLSTDPTIQPQKSMPVDKKSLQLWSQELFESTKEDVLPDGRKITLERSSTLASSGKRNVLRVVARTKDGQTLTIDRVTKAAVGRQERTLTGETHIREVQTVTRPQLAQLEIKVANLSATRYFYETVVQLPGEYDENYIRLAGNLRIAQASGTMPLASENGPIFNVYGDPEAVSERAGEADDVVARWSGDRQSLWLKNTDGHRVRVAKPGT